MPLVKSFQIYVCMNTHAIGCRLHIIKFPEYFLRVSSSSKVVCSIIKKSSNSQQFQEELVEPQFVVVVHYVISVKGQTCTLEWTTPWWDNGNVKSQLEVLECCGGQATTVLLRRSYLSVDQFKHHLFYWEKLANTSRRPIANNFKP